VGEFEPKKITRHNLILLHERFSMQRGYRRLQKGLLEVFRRFFESFVGRGVEVAGNRFIAQDFGLVLNPGVSLVAPSPEKSKRLLMMSPIVSYQASVN